MSFFGLTHLGPRTPFGHTLHTRNINDFTDEQLATAYDTTEARQHRGTISIDELRILLATAYGGLPPEREVRLFTEVLGRVAPGQGAEAGILIRVSKEAFMGAVAQVRAAVLDSDTFRHIAGVRQVAHEFHSHSLFDEYRHKHRRSHYDPQDKYVKPVTTSQQIGWFTPAKVEQVDRKPNVSCEETRFAAALHLLQ